MRVYRVHDNDGGGEQHVPTFIRGYNNIIILIHVYCRDDPSGESSG